MMMTSLVLALVVAVQAPPDTLRLADAIRIALQQNPMLRAAGASAAAADARIGPAGALPDPQLQFGLMNRMASDFGSTADPMTMNQVQVMQMVPWPGRLGRARAAARHTAAAERAGADEQGRMLAAQVRMAYADVAYADRATSVMQHTLELLRGFRDVATQMYGVGETGQQDVLRAQVEVARMSEEVTRMGQDRIAGGARLNALLGRSATETIGALELPDSLPGELPPVDTLVAWALDGRAALVAGRERVAAAQAALGAARLELLPDLQLGFAYQHRPAFPTMVSLMVGMNVPLFAGSRQLAARREMTALRDMSEADLAGLQNETTARVVELRALAERDRNLIRLYRSSVLPQARAAVDAALSGYRVGRVTFMQLVDNQMTVNRYETEVYQLAADYQQAAGELAALTGRPVEAQP
jgi:cobalt-zinc-cadmium efflux system outer membrane protein